MRSLVALILVLSVAAPAVAQPSFELTDADIDAELEGADKLEASGKRLRTVGTVVAVAGVAGLLGGGLMVREGNREAERSEGAFAGVGNVLGGSMLLIGGSSLVLTSAFILAAGQGRIDRAEARRRHFGFAPNAEGGFSAAVGGSF